MARPGSDPPEARWPGAVRYGPPAPGPRHCRRQPQRRPDCRLRHGYPAARHDRRRTYRPDLGHARQRSGAALGPAWSGGGQALHRGRGRSHQPGAGAPARRLRLPCADDFRTRPGPYRWHPGQAGEYPRLSHPPWPRAVSPGGGRGGLRHRRSRCRPGASRSPAVCHPRCHRHGGVGGSDHRLHPGQETGRWPGCAGHGRQDWRRCLHG